MFPLGTKEVELLSRRVGCLHGKFSFVLNHKFGISNKVADALSWKHSLFSTLSYDILGLIFCQKTIPLISLFKDFLEELHAGDRSDYLLINGYPSKGNQLCLPEGFNTAICHR